MKDTQLIANGLACFLNKKLPDNITYFAESCSLGVEWLSAFRFYLNESSVYFVLFSKHYGITPTTKLELETILGFKPSENERSTSRKRYVVILTDKLQNPRLTTEFLKKQKIPSHVSISLSVYNSPLDSIENTMRDFDVMTLINTMNQYSRLANLCAEACASTLGHVLYDIVCQKLPKLVSAGTHNISQTKFKSMIQKVCYSCLQRDEIRTTIPLAQNRGLEIPDSDDFLENITDKLPNLLMFSYEYEDGQCKIVEAAPQTRDPRYQFGMCFPEHFIRMWTKYRENYTVSTVHVDNLASYMSSRGIFNLQGLFVPFLVSNNDLECSSADYVPTTTLRLYRLFALQLSPEALFLDDKNDTTIYSKNSVDCNVNSTGINEQNNKQPSVKLSPYTEKLLGTLPKDATGSVFSF